MIPQSFAQEEDDWKSWGDESKINISIIGNSIINLDSKNLLLRAYVDVVNYNPSDGRYTMKIVQPSSEQIISEKEIVIREKSNGEAGTDIAYMINEDDIISNGTTILGDYSIEVHSDKGTAIGAAMFSIIHPSESGITAISQETELEENVKDSEELDASENIDKEIEEKTEIENIQKIPDWVKNIFVLYADGNITENELISALSFLIDEGIILVNQ